MAENSWVCGAGAAAIIVLKVFWPNMSPIKLNANEK